MHPRQQRQPHCSNPRVRGAWSCLHAASTQTGPALATRCSSCKTLDCLHSLACDVMGKDRVCECECVFCFFVALSSSLYTLCFGAFIHPGCVQTINK